MKISLAQINCHIGNFSENSSRIKHYIDLAGKEKADLVVFPELSICGYPPLDLLERKDFIDRCREEVESLAGMSADIGILLGAPTHHPEPGGKNLFNSAYFLYNGQIEKVFHKSLLPTYDIFDEYRYFEPNKDFSLLEFRGKRIAVTICEDLWDEQPFDAVFGKNRLYTLSPAKILADLHPDFLLNIAASPFANTRVSVKEEIFSAKARKHRIPIFYVNQVGAHTELIFEGASMAVCPDGRIYRQLGFFREEMGTFEVEEVKRSAPLPHRKPDQVALMHDALVLGIRDYFRKQNLSTAVVGLSGGIDSALTLVLAVRALGNENVRALLLPSRFSSRGSVEDASLLAERLGVRYDLISIEKIFNTVTESLSPVFEGTGEDVTEENIQARIRSVLAMAVSNKFGNILLNTSNKSEAAVGYGTLYGDMCGGLSVLGDVYKTDVYRLAAHINKKEEVIPRATVEKPPSAELRENQLDSDALPPYDVLDPILYNFIELQLSPGEIISRGFDRNIVLKVVELVNSSEYKRYQAPPVLRVSSKAFGFGRRIPIVARKNWGI